MTQPLVYFPPPGFSEDRKNYGQGWVEENKQEVGSYSDNGEEAVKTLGGPRYPTKVLTASSPLSLYDPTSCLFSSTWF